MHLKGSRFFIGLRMEDFVSRLSESLSEEKKSHCDPFRPAGIFIPNRNVRRYLQLTLSEYGHSFHTQYYYLEAGIRFLLQSLSGTPAPEILSRAAVQRLIIRFFYDNPENSLVPVFFPESLKNKDYFSTDGFTRKLWYLSEKLARLFSDYEYHRTGMIENWLGIPEGTDIWGSDFTDAEQKFKDHPVVSAGRDFETYRKVKENQRKLFTEIMKSANEGTLLWNYASGLFSDSARANLKPPESPSRIHIFGFSQLSRMHISLLFKLSEFYNFDFYIPDTGHSHLFKTKKSRETWVPVQSVNPGADGVKDPMQKQWGSPVADLIRMLYRVKKADHSWYIHRDLIRNTDEPWSLKDKSYLIINCPGIYREAESIFQSIQEELRKDPDLRLTDIGILVHDMARYKPVLESVFERDPAKRIPYNLTDFSAGKVSRFASAISVFFDILIQGPSRKSVLELAENPLVQNQWSSKGLDADIWRRWITELRITGSSLKKTDSLLPEKFTWNHGIRRLRLSWVFHSDSADPEASALLQKTGLPADIASWGSEENLSALTEFTETLLNYCALWESSVTLSDRIRLLRSFTDKFIKTTNNETSESAAEDSFHKALTQLTDSWGNDFRIPPGAFRFLAESCLKDISGNKGKFLTDGVTVSAMQPMRPVPFKIVYIPGMREGDFPARTDPGTLDLRSYLTIEGDVGLPAASRHLLLETIQAVKNKVVFTYSGRDIQKDAVHFRCGPLYELQSSLFPEIRTEAGIRKDPVYKNLQWEERCAGLRLMRSSAGNQEDTAGTSQPSSALPEAAEKISLKSIADYYKNPLNTWLKNQARIYNPEDSEEEFREDEPFSHSSLESSSLRRDVISEYFSFEDSQPDFDQVFRKKYRNLEFKSLTPVSPFSDYAQKTEKEKERYRLNAVSCFFNNKDIYNIDVFYNGISFGSTGDTKSFYQLQYPSAMAEISENKKIPVDFSLPFLFKLKNGTWGSLIAAPFSSNLSKKPKILENLLYPFVVFSFIKNADFSSLKDSENRQIPEDIRDSVKRNGFVLKFLKSEVKPNATEESDFFQTYEFSPDEIPDFSDLFRAYQECGAHLVTPDVLLNSEISNGLRDWIASRHEPENNLKSLNRLTESLKLWFLDHPESLDEWNRMADYYRSAVLEEKEVPENLQVFLEPAAALFSRFTEGKNAGKKEN